LYTDKGKYFPDFDVFKTSIRRSVRQSTTNDSSAPLPFAACVLRQKQLLLFLGNPFELLRRPTTEQAVEHHR